MSERLLTTAEAAERLGISQRTLEQWRGRGNGPIYRKLGSHTVRYDPIDLRRFIADGARINTGGATP